MCRRARLRLSGWGGIQITPDGNVSDPDRAFDQRIGYWIPLEATDRLNLSMKLTWPAEGFFEASYDPDARWKIACRWDEVEQKRKQAADAYEISRRSLVDRVMEVLKEEQKCRVRMKDGSEMMISEWIDDEASVDVDPLFVTLSDRIAVGLVEPREVKSQAELELQLKSYQSAAKSAGARARVLVRLSADAKDDVFRTSLKGLANQGFGSVGMTRFPK